MSCGGFWLDSKCIEILSRLGELIKKIRLAARLHPEKIEQYCRQLAELVKLAVELEEMREKVPETASAGSVAKLEPQATEPPRSQPRAAGKVSRHG